MEDAVDRRGALVQEASRRWRSQLIDLGGRNTLLYYRDLRAGTLERRTEWTTPVGGGCGCAPPGWSRWPTAA